eukprot:TRINITY_DN59933_c0_g1_i1.p1 TRINITY_DN59933_c0_g1~~TRINITY_DN59933_c0_g1_i1.p1  ORF type:complete len:388 (+),score=122.91 TRINITY_DN59933_c0_g1_i1:86-1165(+)
MTAAEGGESQEGSIEWLRAHGVEVETPADRAAASRVRSAAAAGGADHWPQVPCALLPADPDAPAEIIRPRVPPAADSGSADPYVAALASRFAGGGDVRADLVGEQLKQTAAAAGADAADPAYQRSAAEAMRRMAEGGRCECFTLDHPCEQNDFTQVALYVDEIGVLKALPLNPRAVALAQACGFAPPPPIHGDVVVARLRGRPGGPQQALPFTTEELAPGALWTRAAAGRRAAAAAAAEAHQPQDESGGSWQAVRGGVRWADAPAEVRVAITVPEKTRGKDVNVTIATSTLRVSLGKVELLSVELSHPVRADESTWTLEREGGECTVLVTLEKCPRDGPGTWARLGADRTAQPPAAVSL